MDSQRLSATTAQSQRPMWLRLLGGVSITSNVCLSEGLGGWGRVGGGGGGVLPMPRTTAANPASIFTCLLCLPSLEETRAREAYRRHSLKSSGRDLPTWIKLPYAPRIPSRLLVNSGPKQFLRTPDCPERRRDGVKGPEKEQRDPGEREQMVVS